MTTTTREEADEIMARLSKAMAKAGHPITCTPGADHTQQQTLTVDGVEIGYRIERRWAASKVPVLRLQVGRYVTVNVEVSKTRPARAVEEVLEAVEKQREWLALKAKIATCRAAARALSEEYFGPQEQHLAMSKVWSSENMGAPVVRVELHIGGSPQAVRAVLEVARQHGLIPKTKG